MQVTAVEVYGNEITDLLLPERGHTSAPPSPPTVLPGTGRAVIKGCTAVQVESEGSLQGLLTRMFERRRESVDLDKHMREYKRAHEAQLKVVAAIQARVEEVRAEEERVEKERIKLEEEAELMKQRSATAKAAWERRVRKEGVGASQSDAGPTQEKHVLFEEGEGKGEDQTFDEDEEDEEDMFGSDPPRKSLLLEGVLDLEAPLHAGVLRFVFT
jgi:hypothetical protein